MTPFKADTTRVPDSATGQNLANAPLSEWLSAFSYDADTGRITCNATGRFRDPVDSRIGYRRVSFKNRQYYAHRVAWALHYGAEPIGYIDHIDGDRSNNCIKNLRDLTKEENNVYRCMRRSSKAPYPGVRQCAKTGRWRAYITIKKQRKSLGTYATVDLAIQARQHAEGRLEVCPTKRPKYGRAGDVRGLNGEWQPVGYVAKRILERARAKRETQA